MSDDADARHDDSPDRTDESPDRIDEAPAVGRARDGSAPASMDDPTTTSADDYPTDPAELPDVKTMPDGTSIKRSTHPVEWEAVGRDAIADLLRNQRDAVERDVGEAIATLEVGTPVDPVHLMHLRDAIEALEVTVEKRLAPVTDDAEPWERTVGRVPRGRMYDALDLSRKEVNRLKEQREEDESQADEG